MKKLILGLLFMANVAHAQTDLWQDDIREKLSIGFTPQYLIQQAVRLEVLSKPFKSNLYFHASPYIYNGYAEHYFEQREVLPAISYRSEKDFDRVSGWGVQFTLRHGYQKPFEAAMFFFEYGVGYHSINLDYRTFGLPETGTLNGLPVVRLTTGDVTESITRWDYVFLAGIKRPFGVSPLFYFEIVGGPVIRRAIVKNRLEERTHDCIVASHGYNGLSAQVTFSIGVNIF
jgi:hypothetical protein